MDYYTSNEFAKIKNINYNFYLLTSYYFYKFINNKKNKILDFDFQIN